MKSKIIATIRDVVIFALIMALVYLFYDCPFELIFGIPCAGCGLSSALLSVLKLDFAGAMEHHPLIFLIMAEFVYLLFIRRFVKPNKMIEVAVGIATLVLLFVIWIIRVWII